MSALGVPEARRRPALSLDVQVMTTDELALALGGEGSSFTGQLLLLIAKADQSNRPRLALAFPRTFIAWQIWQSTMPAPTVGELLDRLAVTLGEEPYHRAEAPPAPIEATVTLRTAPAP